MTAGVKDGWLAASDGVRIAYRDHGGIGRGLVLLHGGAANLESMDQYATRLGAARRTVAIDLRSCGQSDDAPHFTLTDAAGDVRLVVEELQMGPVDVVGHSMGGFVAGLYGTANAHARIVSIDGFGPGMVTVGSAADRVEFRAFQDQMRAAFFEMTSAPDTGDRAWRDEQVDLLAEIYPRMGYTAPNARAMALRNFVELDDGRFRRRPPRHLFADAFADDGDLDILRMYRDVRCPTLIIRCSHSEAPEVLDRELAALSATNHMVQVVSLPLTHLAPAWDAIDEVVGEIERFLGPEGRQPSS
jgi:pimeloyl-ACP methyl ester carboxylesterase